MTKQQIIEEISERTGLSRAEARESLESIMDIFSKAFIAGDNIYLRGFGTFIVRQAKEKSARIFATGSKCIIPSHKTVKFKISTELKNLLK